MDRDVVELHAGLAIMLLGRPESLAALSRHNPAGRAQTLGSFGLGEANRLKLRRWYAALGGQGAGVLSDQGIVASLDGLLGNGRLVGIVINPALRPAIIPYLPQMQQRAASALAKHPPPPPPVIGAPTLPTKPPPLDVVGMGLEERLLAVIRIAARRAPGSLGHALLELASPENFALLLAIFVVGVAAQDTPAGPVVDAALLAAAYFYGGMAAVHALIDLFKLARAVFFARDREDLENAADALVRIAVALAVIGLVALLHRMLKPRIGRGAKKPPPERDSMRPRDPPRRLARRPEEEPPPPKPKAEPKAPPPDLDAQFGAPKPPGGARGIKDFEQVPGNPSRAVKNPTLQKVKPGTPPKLDPAKAKDPGYIWAIDEDGTLLIGEEVPVGAKLPDGYQPKLGHPTLTEGGPARVAGELKYENGEWTINNNSGRYSSHADRGPDKLSNAADLFKNSGVDVKQSFNPDRLPPK
jgi:hypothetical protein